MPKIVLFTRKETILQSYSLSFNDDKSKQFSLMTDEEKQQYLNENICEAIPISSDTIEYTLPNIEDQQ